MGKYVSRPVCGSTSTLPGSPQYCPQDLGQYGTGGISTESGFFFFKFSSEDDLSAVLDRAPWHMANRPLVLKRWHRDMTLLKERRTTDSLG